MFMARCAFGRRTAAGFHRRWFASVERLGRINGPILLSLACVLIVTPLGALRRGSGGDPPLRRTRGRASYWTPLDRPRQSKASFDRTY